MDEETRVSFSTSPSSVVAQEEEDDEDITEVEESSETSGLIMARKTEEPTGSLWTFICLHGSLLFLIGSLWASAELSLNLFSIHVVAASGFTVLLLGAVYVMLPFSFRTAD
jgi:hypothetical protein